MKIRIVPILFAQLLLLVSVAQSAHAEEDRQVWRDSEGEIVHNSWGACVRSIWKTDQDPCAEPKVAAIVPPKPHTEIVVEERTVYFAFNHAELSPEAKTRLDALVERLSSADDISGVKIVGYADRIGTASYNKALSMKRAKTVSDYMIDHKFVKPSATETRWVGKSDPSTNCPANQSHQQLIACLQPDRKVTVELQYKATTVSSR